MTETRDYGEDLPLLVALRERIKSLGLWHYRINVWKPDFWILQVSQDGQRWGKACEGSPQYVSGFVDGYLRARKNVFS